MKPYLGCGPAAVSTLPAEPGPVRIENRRTIEPFLVRPAGHNRAIRLSGYGETVEELTPAAFFLEHLMLGLRLKEGVERRRMVSIFGADPVELIAATIDRWNKSIVVNRYNLALHDSGRNFLDAFLRDAAVEIGDREIFKCEWP
jgi:coproporphyrinogen III oxidase-like Fe-S oxidoreductase